MTDVQTAVGRSAQDKPINLSQLQDELLVAGVACTAGLGMASGLIYTYDTHGQPSDFPTEQRAAADQVISDHVAMRDKTSAEYAAEFQDPSTTLERKQEIRDIQSGLLPPEQVPMAMEDMP